MSSFPAPSKKFDDDSTPVGSDAKKGKQSEDPKAILKKVIEKELEKKVPITAWSQKIENDLIASVISSFEKYFPSQSLCKTTLKTLFTKIKAAMTTGASDEPFSLQVFLKNHLQLCFEGEGTREPYRLSLDLATELKNTWKEEKIAKLSISELSAPIWSIQKHLLAPIKQRQLRAPFEVYSQEDVVILDAMIALLIDNPLIENSELVKGVEEKVKQVELLAALNEEKKIKPLLYSLYAQLCLDHHIYDRYFSKLEQEHMKQFIDHFTCLAKGSSQTLSNPEWAERLVSLYILGVHLSKSLPGSMVEKSIDGAISQLKGEKKEPTASNKNLTIFFNAALYLHCYFSRGTSYEQIREFLMQSYEMTRALVPPHPVSMEYLECFIYSALELRYPLIESSEPKACGYLKELLMKIFVENPYFTPQTCLGKTLNLCNSRLKLATCLSEKKLARIKLKIHMWAASREMVMRQVHVADNHPFKVAISRLWKEVVGHKIMSFIDHHRFIASIMNEITYEYPVLKGLQVELKKTVSTYYMVFWYNMNFDYEAATIDRWLFWHYQNLSLDGSYDQDQLEKLCTLFFPNIPQKQCLTRFQTLIKKHGPKNH